VRRKLVDAGLWDTTPAGLRAYLARVERDRGLETPKPGDEAFRHVETRIIASNRIALEGAAARARELGCDARTHAAPLSGQAADVGRHVAGELLRSCATRGRHLLIEPPLFCVLWGGETVVTLPADSTGARGGRCQELALAAAGELAASVGVALLAAGTDGRDGPTDAAGAVVDGGTWDAVRRGGRDPARDLAAHDAYPALDAAGALLRTGLTGTNVMDIVIGACRPRPSRGRA
jgi:glycerate-2-kinase